MLDSYKFTFHNVLDVDEILTMSIYDQKFNELKHFYYVIQLSIYSNSYSQDGFHYYHI